MPYVNPDTYTAGQTLSAASLNKFTDSVSFMPRGYAGHALKTSDQGSISTTVDLSSLSVSVDQVNGRRYRISASLDVFTTNADTTFVCTLTDGSNNQLTRTTARLPYANTSQTMTFVWYESASSTATVTRKLRMGRAAGTGTITVQAGATAPAVLLVEDIGAA